MDEKYKMLEVRFSDGNRVDLLNPVLKLDRENCIVFEVENRRYWFNLSKIDYTVITYLSSIETIPKGEEIK